MLQQSEAIYAIENFNFMDLQSWNRRPNNFSLSAHFQLWLKCIILDLWMSRWNEAWTWIAMDVIKMEQLKSNVPNKTVGSEQRIWIIVMIVTILNACARRARSCWVVRGMHSNSTLQKACSTTRSCKLERCGAFFKIISNYSSFSDYSACNSWPPPKPRIMGTHIRVRMYLQS